MGTQIREVTQFGRIEYEMLKASGRFEQPAPEANLAHIRETAMREFDKLVVDPKSAINTKLGGVKNIRTVRVYLVDEKVKLDFALIKTLGMLEEEAKQAARKAAEEARKTKRAAKSEKDKKPAKGPFKRPNKPADPKKATFAKGKKARRPRQDDGDERPFKPAEITGRVVLVERVTIPQRNYH